MNAILQKVGVPLRAVWLPTGDPKEHARINLEEGLVMIYDKDEGEAFNSLFHEILEFRIRKVTGPYKRLVNALIGALEAEVYAQKEKALAEILNDFGVWKEFEAEPSSPANYNRRKNGKRHNRLILATSSCDQE